jgi:hypothetical protein
MASQKQQRVLMLALLALALKSSIEQATKLNLPRVRVHLQEAYDRFKDDLQADEIEDVVRELQRIDE